MSKDPGSADNVSKMVDLLLKSKDPASVGLRRILKKKQDEGKEFPLKSINLNELSKTPLKNNQLFTETEQHVLELEKKAAQQKNTIETLTKEHDDAMKRSRQEGVFQGLEQGAKQGYEKAQKEFNDKIKGIEERLALIFRNIESTRKQMYTSIEQDVLSLSVAIAQKILSTEISTNKELILTVIKKALSYISDKQNCIIRVAANDFGVVTEKKDIWLSISERAKGITIEQDERIAQGGCIIESSSGIADARLHIQSEEMMTQLQTLWNSIVSSQNDQPSDKGATSV